MFKMGTTALILASSLLLSYASQSFADCPCPWKQDKCREKTCNQTRHPSRYVGVYFRTDVSAENALLASLPLITLNEDGTAIVYFGEALIDYVTQGTISPTYGNWKPVGDCQVLVMTIGFNSLDTPASETFNGERSTLLLDFSQSLNFPTIVARSLVQFDAGPTSAYLDPTAGTLIFNDPITPRQLQRVCAFASDLTRSS